MRDIEFRYTWQHDETGRFYSKIFSLDEIEDGQVTLQLNMMVMNWGWPIKRDQFSGITDIRDMKIFENDIVRKNGKVCQVIFSEKAAKFCVRIKKLNCGRAVNKVYSLEGCEVIGNIHETPELLK